MCYNLTVIIRKYKIKTAIFMENMQHCIIDSYICMQPDKTEKLSDWEEIKKQNLGTSIITEIKCNLKIANGVTVNIIYVNIHLKYQILCLAISFSIVDASTIIFLIDLVFKFF